MDSPFEEVHNHKAASLREEVPEKVNQRPSENDSKDSVHDFIHPLIPCFEMVPQDVHVLCGEEFTCSCKPNGAKPVGRHFAWLSTDHKIADNICYSFLIWRLLIW